jgi:putative holliday junction resolvase
MSRLGRRLAFDYGDTRIGVAVCDPDGILATPLSFLVTKDPALKVKLAELLHEYEPVKIYVGYPLHLSGEESGSSQKAEKFAQLVGEISERPVELVDERLTTSTASAALSQAGIKTRDQRGLIDSQAAVLILEQGLSRDRG